MRSYFSRLSSVWLRLDRRRWSLVSIAVLLLATAWIWASRSPESAGAAQLSAPQEGFFAPALSLETLDGGKASLAELKGQVVLVNFWASWCPPCKAEMQAIQNTYQAYRDQGFTVLAVNAANQDSAEAARQFVQAEGLTFPILMDTAGEADRAYRVSSLPTSFFVDRQGKIRLVVIGGPMAEALLRSRVSQLLKGGD